MSRVILIAADKPLLLCSRQEVRTKTLKLPNGEDFVIDYEAGFQVEEHSYYRYAVDELGYSMKPCQYELSFEEVEKDLHDLCSYLRENFTPGETVELWSVWVGDEPHPELLRRSKPAAEVDMALLNELNWADQLCITITI